MTRSTPRQLVLTNILVAILNGNQRAIGQMCIRDSPKGMAQQEIELARSSEDEKQSQLTRLADFQTRNADQAPKWLALLKQTVIENGNVFAVLVEAVRYCSLGQITTALYDVGGQYRRSM